MVTFSAPTRHHLEKGFTLIELLVVIVMLAVLLLALIFTFNPITQINKAKDLDRQHSLEQIKSALDSYYNDKGCYPTTLSFGSSWKVNTITYFTKLPQDPDYISGSTTNLPYVYQTDGSSCPQWNVLYAGLRGPISKSVSCSLAQRDSCTPQGFDIYYNFCLPSGAVDCRYIASSTLSTAGKGSGSGGTGSTPTPTPYPITCPANNYFGCTGDNRCNSIQLDQSTGTPTQCVGFGGTLQCYCDNLCRVNGVKQCAN